MGPAQEESGNRPDKQWSRRWQFAFVGIVMPVVVFLLVGAPYLLWHNFTYKLYIVIPPPLGGARALEGHWTDAPAAPVTRVKFGAVQPVFGWLAPDDELTTEVVARARGKISLVNVKVGDTVAPGAPLFTVAVTGVTSGTGDAEVAVTDSVVTAPVAGTVTQVGFDLGQIVRNPNAAAVSITDLSKLWVTVAIDEVEGRLLRTGQAIEVQPIALPGRTIVGRAINLSPTDPDTQRVTVRIAVDNPDGALKIGSPAKLVFADGDDAESLAVPESAVVYESGAARVFVVTSEKNSRGVSTALQPRAIHVGRIRGGMVEVLDGLVSGENVEATDALFIDRAARGY